MPRQRDRAVLLLLKAIRTLPEEEQDEVLRGLFRREPWVLGEPVFAGREVEVKRAPAFEVAKQTAQPLLVRLPAGLHDRLRRWSTSHGFSMAAVARGLIERFLDQQEGREAE